MPVGGFGTVHRWGASDDAAGVRLTVIIEKEKSSPTPVVIERNSDKDVKVDVEVDKD